MTLADVIAQVAARAADLERAAESLPVPESAPIALQLAAMGIADGLWLLGEQIRDAAGLAQPRPIAEAAPALDLWRRTVLENPRRYSKLDQSAAWELTALECERAGNTHGADRARREAAYVVGIRGVA